MVVEQILAFVIVTIALFPLINKVVRLANTAWNEREYLEEERFRQVAIFAPLVTIVIFMLFYFGVVALLQLVEI